MAVRRIDVTVIGAHKQGGSALTFVDSNEYDLNEENRDAYIEKHVQEAIRRFPDHQNLRVARVSEEFFDEEEQEMSQRVIYYNGEWLEV